MVARQLRGVLFFAAVAVTAATAACGGNSSDPAIRGEPVVSVTNQGTVGGDASASPPDAVARSEAGEIPLAMGSACWAGGGEGACVSALPPSARTDLPTLRVRAGDNVQFLFEFTPKQVLVALLGKEDSQLLVTELAAKASTRWPVPDESPEAAFVVVRAKAEPGSVSYVAQLESR